MDRGVDGYSLNVLDIRFNSVADIVSILTIICIVNRQLRYKHICRPFTIGNVSCVFFLFLEMNALLCTVYVLMLSRQSDVN